MGIPPTHNGKEALPILGAMQKHIRRGLERDAMRMACELLHTDKRSCSMVVNRLELIAHEDVDILSHPEILTFVRTCGEQAKAWWEGPDPAKARMAIGSAVRMLARAPKSREGDHFQGAIGYPNLYGEDVPEVPEWCQDHHTREGKAKGRGQKYFREVSAKLHPAPDQQDEYEEPFYEVKNRLESGTMGDNAQPPLMRGD